MERKVKKVMAVASAGGHWIELLRMKPTFDQFDTIYVSTNVGLASHIPGHTLKTVRDASMWNKFGLLVMAMQIFWVVLRHRPDVIVTTGAAPGFFALMFGRLLGARTIWVDSIANAQELSLAGKKASMWADHWLTQWPELARENGPYYIGSVL